MMDQYKQLKLELAEAQKIDTQSKKIKLIKERAIFNDLMAKHGVCMNPNCLRKDHLTLDHIVPQAVLGVFGLDILRDIIEGNYQLLCKVCNIYKGNKLDWTLPKTKQVIQWLLNNL